MRVRLSDRARSDLHNILVFSERNWGVIGRRNYRAKLHTAFELLGDQPNLGMEAIEFGSGLRALLVGQHIIFYKIGSNEIEIVRILHERSDAASHISQQIE